MITGAIKNRIDQIWNAFWSGGISKENVRDGVHVLRHTFCSHLAMRGAPARAIQNSPGTVSLA